MGLDSAYGIGSLKPGVCTSSTRPSSPFEGQMIYETDTDILAIWNGTAWRYIAAATATSGSILQVKTFTYGSGQYTQATAGTTFVDTQLSVSITPVSTSSKVLILVQHYAYIADASAALQLQLMRGATVIANTGYLGNGNSANNDGGFTMMYVDSPSTTSATTYKTQFCRASGTGAVYLGRISSEETITVMEIAG
jgi:hypothetical protein